MDSLNWNSHIAKFVRPANIILNLCVFRYVKESCLNYISWIVFDFLLLNSKCLHIYDQMPRYTTNYISNQVNLPCFISLKTYITWHQTVCFITVLHPCLKTASLKSNILYQTHNLNDTCTVTVYTNVQIAYRNSSLKCYSAFGHLSYHTFVFS